ncbi:PCC domain-containing protein [Prochlorococcus marinus]|uniref:DUF296 domain-containing protein n=1 Tax=Prochlorococcus marinus XMU1408 TaxID=2213228 RepID=A0A318R426_PROMR|nr:DUF296 domain-containing protein [Prochlorococcus marinus]MBW3041803.1 DUF296 domain-containing protein [Prochlorococcus marinus str. XMU1408]PYE02944.1 DUF296 domain-containing protein [Prochlorococcus marinus XMU1408]
MEHFFYKLSSGADVFNSLIELQIKHNSSSFLISAVGDLSKVSFKCPLNEKPVILEKKLEIITLSGYLTSSDSHVHISVSDENCAVFGGHLLSGTTVLKSLDILLGVTPNLSRQSIKNLSDNPVCVDIYVLSDCPWCKRALKLLDSYNIDYNYNLITNDDEFKKISNITSVNTFPQIFINNEFIGGYSELAKLSTLGSLNKLIN